MPKYNYNISMRLDKDEYLILNKAISLLKVISSMVSYGEHVDDCDTITTKIENKLEIISTQE